MNPEAWVWSFFLVFLCFVLKILFGLCTISIQRLVWCVRQGAWVLSGLVWSRCIKTGLIWTGSDDEGVHMGEWLKLFVTACGCGC